MLGDIAAQDAVRAKHPGTHCPMLRQNPSACTGCANNPHERPERQREADVMRGYAPLLNRAFRLHTLAELGLLNRDGLSAADVQMLAIAHDRILLHRMKAQAALIAEQVAKMTRF